MNELMTLDEWRCSRYGHDYEHVVSGAGELVRVRCGWCGKGWDVAEVE